MVNSTVIYCLNVYLIRKHYKSFTMSVQTLSIHAFNYIHAGIEKAAYNGTVNDFYFYPVAVHFKNRDIEKELKRLVTSWAEMNYESYYARYTVKENLKFPIAEFLDFKAVGESLTAIQLLKYVDSLKYNIDPELLELTEQRKEDLELLAKLQEGIQGAIIGNMKAYKDAAWNE